MLLLTGIPVSAAASDWTGFRGPGSRGISSETGLPVTWSETENLAWKTPLPGPGSSGPIVLGDKVFVTCYSGYGLDPHTPGELSHLKRHLICIRTGDGTILWDKAIPAAMPEDPYKAMLREHGYASQTPVTDGEHLYVFFGKTGVLAFDLDGRQLWQHSVGTGSDKALWGSASSPALTKNMVIVNAWDESKTLYALDKKTGKEIWKRDLSETGLTFTTPVLNERADGVVELVVSLPSQVWGLDPETGQTLWFARTGIDDSMIPTPVIVDGVAYIHGGGPRSFGSLAVRTGGTGDVTNTHIVWSSKEVASPPSLVVAENFLYWVNDSGKAFCMNAQTAELQFSEQLPATGRFAVYASPVTAEGRIYIVTRKKGTIVIAAKPQFQLVAHNMLASDESDCNASLAVGNKCLFLRSNRYLYCIKNAL
ncbi:MAG: PQQ-binding-like beta-propeller repeat protein [Sedimentisphaerales bacterium]|nr:PQQ-binding-like beta-propeller repeat protein [Sedimentisphaerales bacterium]